MKRKWRWLLLTVTLLAVLAYVYKRTHPLVFMDTHRYCIVAACIELEQYAQEHEGRYPYHPKGYGNAVLLTADDSLHAFTGPGYDPTPLRAAKKNGTELTEEECSRVYIQNLTRKCSSEIVLLFDKLPTPGGDHTPLPFRLWASTGREVAYVGVNHGFVRERDWAEFARKQVELLVKEGLDRQEAERLYSCGPK